MFSEQILLTLIQHPLVIIINFIVYKYGVIAHYYALDSNATPNSTLNNGILE